MTGAEGHPPLLRVHVLSAWEGDHWAPRGEGGYGARRTWPRCLGVFALTWALGGKQQGVGGGGPDNVCVFPSFRGQNAKPL